MIKDQDKVKALTQRSGSKSRSFASASTPANLAAPHLVEVARPARATQAHSSAPLFLALDQIFESAIDQLSYACDLGQSPASGDEFFIDDDVRAFHAPLMHLCRAARIGPHKEDAPAQEGTEALKQDATCESADVLQGSALDECDGDVIDVEASVGAERRLILHFADDANAL